MSEPQTTQSPTPTAHGPSRVLFIGNSYTFYNDLPGLFVELARSGGHQVQVGMSAEGGATLSDHASSMVTRRKLEGEQWDYVVLQEQSQIPAILEPREGEMLPAAGILVDRITETGATPILFMTWGNRDGLRRAGYPDYQSQQTGLEEGYLAVAEQLNLALAPVGIAWGVALEADPELDLWAGDGAHPSLAGSYLVACVFYALLFNESPEGLAYSADLPLETARALQTIAGEVVLADLGRWHPSP